MHIGLLTAELTPAHGWATYSLNLIQALARYDLRLTILCARDTPEGLPLLYFRFLPSLTPMRRFTSARLLLSAPRVRHLLHDVDVIHATAEPYAPLAMWAARERPVFITAHGSYVRLPEVRAAPVSGWYRRAFERAHLLCVSAYTAQVAQTVIPGAQTTVIPNGVDAQRFAQLPAPDVAKPGPIILTTGGVKPRKGTLELVRAMRIVHAQRPDARCVMLGALDAHPDYVQQVRAAIAEHGLNEVVHLAGFVDDHTMRQWYGAADLFVLPSLNAGWKFEGFGLVHLEAGAAGLPVIGTRGNGAADAIDEGVTGLLVDQERLADELPEAILRLLNDPALARRMGDAGRRKAQAQTWARVAEQVVTLYRASL